MPSRPYVTKVVQNGNSLGLNIPLDIRRAKDIKRGDWFAITVVDDSIVFTKLKEPGQMKVAGAAAASAVAKLNFEDEGKAIA